MYHTTTAENAESILREGLKPKSHGGYTSAYGDAQLTSYYPRRPAFLSVKPWPKSGRWNTILRVDVRGVPLAADIPTVVEMVGLNWGMLQLDELDAEGNSIYEYRPPDNVLRILGPVATRKTYPSGKTEVFVDTQDLAKAGSAAAKAAIKLTGTAAVYETIDPSRISLR